MSASKPQNKVLEERLRQIFENQLVLLTERGAPPVVISYLQSKWKEVIVRAAGFADFPDGLIFLPVIPLVFVGLPVLVSFVRNNSKPGVTFLNPHKVWDVEIAPSMPYYIFGVDSGKKFLKRPLAEAGGLIARRHRHQLTSSEVISLAVYDKVSAIHDLAASGSRCWNGEAFPGLCCSGISSELIGYYLNEPNERWIVPSCSERF